MRNKKRIATLIIVFGVLLGIVSIVKARLTRNAWLAAITTQASERSNEQRGPTRMVRFILFENGIYPQKLKIQAGLVNLNVEDKTHRSRGLSIERENGNGGNERSPVSTITTRGDKARGRQVLKLIPGIYHVFDQSQPQSTATLIVEP